MITDYRSKHGIQQHTQKKATLCQNSGTCAQQSALHHSNNYNLIKHAYKYKQYITISSSIPSHPYLGVYSSLLRCVLILASVCTRCAMRRDHLGAKVCSPGAHLTLLLVTQISFLEREKSPISCPLGSIQVSFLVLVHCIFLSCQLAWVAWFSIGGV